MNPTEKQLNVVGKIVDKLGPEKVIAYIKKFFPSVAKLDALTRKQAQKIITGLQHYLPPKPSGYKDSYLNYEWFGRCND